MEAAALLEARGMDPVGYVDGGGGHDNVSCYRAGTAFEREG